MTQAALARIRYGADPELFLAHQIKTPQPAKEGKRVKTQTSFKPIPITGMIGGSKQNPLALSANLKGWEGISKIPANSFIQEDGCALEFNVAPAPNTSRLLRDCYGIVEAVRQFAERKGLKIYEQPSAEFTEDVKRDFPQAFIVGCDPDLSAYTNMPRTCPDGIANSLVRHAGGHFHVGYDKELVPTNIVVQFLDLFLGLPSVFVDKQGLRRQFYGQAGSFRVKEYGVEYRTLSNFWVPGVSPKTIGYETTEYLFAGIDTFMSHLITKMGDLEHIHKLINWKEVETAINTENEQMALQILGFGSKINPTLFKASHNFAVSEKRRQDLQKAKLAKPQQQALGE